MSGFSITRTDNLAKPRQLAAWLTLFTLVLAGAGCRIPGLRCATPGAPLPERYAWNNGHPYVTPRSPTQPSRPPKVEPQSNSNNQFGPEIQPVSFEQSLEPQARIRTTGNQDVTAVPTPPVSPPQTLPQETLGPAPQTDLATDNGPAPPTPPTIELVPAEQAELQIFDTENSARLPHEVFFNDPYLSLLISQALVDNQELKKLSEEIQVARNEAYALSGEYLPFVSLGTGVGIDKSGKYTRFGALEDQLEVAPGRDFPEPLPDFLTAGKMSWEIDIWSRMRNAQRSATMRFLGTQDGRNYVVTRLVAEIAENYYSLLALDLRRETLDLTISIQRESLRFAEAQKIAGAGTELAVQRFKAEVQKNEAEKSVLMQEIVQIENRINFLLGRYPQPVERATTNFFDMNLGALGAGVPSELLQQRFDIQQAERQVEAAGLDVKVAKARFYPSLNLTAGLGWNAFSTGYLLKTPDSLMYGLASELVGPLINKRAIKAAYASANALQLQSIYNYQQTILRAHVEVVNQITKVENYRRTIEAKRQQLTALEASVAAANKLFQNAQAEYVEVLLAQREMMEARMQLIEIKKEQLSAIVNAYQALGGGAF